jgi:hypothetical protein
MTIARAPRVLAVAMRLVMAARRCPSRVAAASPSSTAAPASTAPPLLTCSTGTNDNGMTASQVIRMLVSDQKSQDKALEENWVTVTDGSETSQGNDLDAAAQSLGSYSGTELAADASQFASDVQTFLTDQSGGLLPGWPSEYDAVATDIHRLADDCDMSFPVGGAAGQQGVSSERPRPAGYGWRGVLLPGRPGVTAHRLPVGDDTTLR